MPLLAVNALHDRPATPDGEDIAPALERALSALPPGAPVVILLHGFRYSPDLAARCPHRRLFSFAPEAGLRRCVSWPAGLGASGQDPAEGLMIGFGWRAAGTIWRAYRRALPASVALARLVTEIRRRRPGPVQILAHSLGARVALAAFRHLPAGAVGRAVLLAGAEFAATAEAARATPAGRAAEIVNVTSRENDLFDLMFERLTAPHRPFRRAISAGLPRPAPNWLDIQIDDVRTRAALARLGFPIPPPEGRVCHWSAYLRPGLFALHARLLGIGGRLAFGDLRAVLPDATEPRWSRLLASRASWETAQLAEGADRAAA